MYFISDPEGAATSRTVSGVASGQTVSIRPLTAAAGYQYLNEYTVYGTEDYSYANDTLTVQNSDVTVIMYYVREEYAITCGSNEGGKVSGSAEYAEYGDQVSFTVSADNTYHIASVTVNGSSINVTDPQFMTFSRTVTGPITVYATFEADPPTTYTITVNADGGSVSGNPGSAAEGDPISISITGPDDPDGGTTYLVSWNVSGVSVNPIESEINDGTNERITFNFTMPAQNVTITTVWDFD